MDVTVILNTNNFTLASTTTSTSDSDGLSSSTLTLGDLAGTYIVAAEFNDVILTFSAEAAQQEEDVP